MNGNDEFSNLKKLLGIADNVVGGSLAFGHMLVILLMFAFGFSVALRIWWWIQSLFTG